jgi:hypothetical protein
MSQPNGLLILGDHLFLNYKKKIGQRGLINTAGIINPNLALSKKTNHQLDTVDSPTLGAIPKVLLVRYLYWLFSVFRAGNMATRLHGWMSCKHKFLSFLSG